MSDDLLIERCWLIECSRCAYETSSFALETHEARGEFTEMGWTGDGEGYQYCPRCSAC